MRKSGIISFIMGNVSIALLFGIGAGVWLANWFYKRTGGNSQKSYTAGAVVGILVFLSMLSLLSMIA